VIYRTFGICNKFFSLKTYKKPRFLQPLSTATVLETSSRNIFKPGWSKPGWVLTARRHVQCFWSAHIFHLCRCVLTCAGVTDSGLGVSTNKTRRYHESDVQFYASTSTVRRNPYDSRETEHAGVENACDTGKIVGVENAAVSRVNIANLRINRDSSELSKHFRISYSLALFAFLPCLIWRRLVTVQWHIITITFCVCVSTMNWKVLLAHV